MFEQVELLNPWIYETENACANFSIWLCDVVTAAPSVWEQPLNKDGIKTKIIKMPFGILHLFGSPERSGTDMSAGYSR